jgi:hypothetical protein
MPTLQLNLTAVRQVADQVADVAGGLAHLAVRLRLPVCPPATDSFTIHHSRRLSQESRRLAYTLESAADELGRVLEAILVYAYNGATLARRTELALMGLAVSGNIEPAGEPSESRVPRSADAPTPPPVVPDGDHEVLSEALLLSQGTDLAARSLLDSAHMRAAASVLHDSARALRAAMSSGHRPAAMLDRFGAWLDNDVAAAAANLDASAADWADAFGSARGQVEGAAGFYRSWLAAAVTGAGRDPVDLPELAARVRAAMREYASTAIAEVRCVIHPRLGVAT